MRDQSRRPARRRRLGSELRALREAASVSLEEAGRALHGDKTKISRQETGQQRVSRLELEVLLGLYQAANEKVRERLIALSAEESRHGWWRRHGEMLHDGFKELLSLEADAVRISAFQTQVVPGLLQTQEYATAVISGCSDPLAKEELDTYVDFRMSRQSIFLRENPPEYRAVIMEGAIRQQIGGAEVLADQLRHLVALSQSPALTIQVVPLSRSVFIDTGGSFVIYSYPDLMDLDVVQVEHLDSVFYLEDDKTVSKYQRVIDGLRGSALPPDRSIQFISSIARDLEGE
ncbi:helix-turn-helix transcriptional regulator [Streptomyces sp. UNOC14_S4]|uniref:helix-turn-helix domain-containing protein n=1 Tax=Streptomyces sp. UNOC14_S4 TaxID=2872340 RepID=UPI001E42DDAC|nr:helix-turn-helix transcriptional regulator [Streptomyces sp. UNOC14_S4]MCC3768745.1 helix-turn-helix domain-containing protein [Streptomyces sp. UNOC14_S4]